MTDLIAENERLRARVADLESLLAPVEYRFGHRPDLDRLHSYYGEYTNECFEGTIEGDICRCVHALREAENRIRRCEGELAKARQEHKCRNCNGGGSCDGTGIEGQQDGIISDEMAEAATKAFCAASCKALLREPCLNGCQNKFTKRELLNMRGALVAAFASHHGTIAFAPYVRATDELEAAQIMHGWFDDLIKELGEKKVFASFGSRSEEHPGSPVRSLWLGSKPYAVALILRDEMNFSCLFRWRIGTWKE